MGFQDCHRLQGPRAQGSTQHFRHQWCAPTTKWPLHADQHPNPYSSIFLRLAARRSGAVVSVDKKVTAGTNKSAAGTGTDFQRIAKLDRENEVAPPPKIAPSVGKAIQTARLEKGLSQKDAAQKINEKPSVLQDYESGKAIPNPQVLGKLERLLGVKLRGAFKFLFLFLSTVRLSSCLTFCRC
jgi:putative transcription factor